MKISLNWLNEFVNLTDISLDQLCEELTMRAFEIEGISHINDNIDSRIVLGEILEIDKHPNADKLQVTKTAIGFNEDGSQNIKQIVCGAKNIAVGQKVPVATLGAKLTNIKGSKIEIKESKIRDVESCGMLCAAEEIGLDEDQVNAAIEEQGNGIFVLFDPKDSKIPNRAAEFKLGTEISKVLGIEKDTVLDIGARSNRGDALSIQGQAREISALFNKELNDLEDGIRDPGSIKRLEALSYLSGGDTLASSVIKPEITDTEDCPLFYTVSLENIEVKESPQWLKDRLKAVGVKSINNLVDISNYVQFELGQPLHFYDKDKLKGTTLVARRAKTGEKIKALDDKEYDLTEDNLLIVDKGSSEIPVAIAGVMGGFDSQITDTTTSIVIEAAVFKAATVRKSSRKAGIESEAKKRFERGVSKINTRNSINRSIELITKLAQGTGGLEVGEIQIAGDEELNEPELTLNIKEVERILGISLNIEEISDILKPLGIRFTGKSNEEESRFSIPSFRAEDIKREIDLVEEIARLYGYNNIPMAKAAMADFKENKDFANLIKINDAKEYSKTILNASGFSQIILSSLVGEWAVHENQAAVKMLNPLSKEYSILRTSMLPSILKAAQRNYASDKSKDIKLFELGKTYSYKVKDEQNIEDTEETDKLAVVLIKQEKSWTKAAKQAITEADFFEMKALISKIYKDSEFTNIEADSENFLHSFMHPGIAAEIKYQGRVAGYLAKIHPAIADEWGLPINVYFAELKLANPNKAKFKETIKNPVIERDITVDLKDKINFNEITNAIKKYKSKDLTEINLIDIYENSYTLRIKWHSEKDLSREHIDSEVQKIKEFMNSKLNVEFRA